MLTAASLLALCRLGYLTNLSDVPTYLGRVYMPNMEHHALYCKARTRQDEYAASVLDTPHP